MSTDQQVEFKKAYVNLISLKNNLPASKKIPEKYVQLFHAELKRLIDLGSTDLKEFMVPESEVNYSLTSYNYMTGGNKHYSKDRYVDREILLIKLDSVLSFLSISGSNTEMGFRLD
jgi:hypothetical protein